MRGTIDCAVLMVPEHRLWMREFVKDWMPTQSRIVLHCVELIDSASTLQEPCLPDGSVLSQLALSLKRYDVCLLPVTLGTLGWTRMALATANGILQTPVLGVVRDMSAAGLQDLLSLGLADFMRYPVCEEEFKIRLAQLSAPGWQDKGEDAVDAMATPIEPGNDDFPPQIRDEPAKEPFQMAKARIVTEFERHYIADLLTQHRGNISQAARAAHKNRRAFWQLMRKHEITADPYRLRKAETGPMAHAQMAG